ncbi:non-ribosomal peptide synthetase [Streptomyces sp. A3M-1-3]|uniref:non-ribosomal peptide synthetase n=1 Tax=Streptomyces sp. A3M-1-3 TaxID=2962044 RepID=UPI0020B6B5A0|nr:non-ribosomal peptide synthetase [Streptomyces sp. A3M-1-3]MCP3820193.1 non-ribosomal peptide synthetase [Streptomyces sp. A3M-1-3]
MNSGSDQHRIAQGRPLLNEPGSGEAKHTVPHLFERVAARAGDDTAVLFEGKAVSYAELNSAANRLARSLISRGVGPDSVVAVSVPKSADLITVLLAVLKAGGAYLTLDPAYPAERLAHMVADAQPVLLIRASEHTELALPSQGVPELVLDDPRFRGDCEAQPDHDVSDRERRAELRPEHLMYVVYTSGSTGRPKGVAVPHSGVVGLVASQAEQIGAGPGDRVLQWASISFDAAFWDISLALLSGAALVMASAEALLPGRPLRDTMVENQVTHATLPPVALSVTEADGVLPGGTLVSTGDAVSPSLVRTWAEGRSMFNGYGPTEVTVGISMGRITGPDDIGIGRPFPGSSVQVLDERLAAAGHEDEGELYLAGPGLARGYLNQPGLSAARFVANPAGPPGSRMYRSGDLGWRRADGELFFAGRVDNQVKLRGFRIELGEIETRLAEHPAVDLACAVVEGDVATARVVAYVTASAGADLTGAGLRSYLARSLPEHMVPYTVVVLDRFPVTPNGKVDRAALSAADARPPVPEPETTRDTDLCGLVQRILGVPEARPEDNFFDLGGHSVLATMLARRIRSEFGVVIPMRTIFQAATLADLAGIVQAAKEPESA